jgi:hypothetical protein
VDTLSPATQRILNAQSFKDIESGTKNASRVWFIVYQQSLDEFAQAGKTHPQLEYLDQHFEFEFIEDWNDIKIYLYRRSGF